MGEFKEMVYVRDLRSWVKWTRMYVGGWKVGEGLVIQQSIIEEKVGVIRYSW